MKNFDYSKYKDIYLKKDIVTMITKIHEYKGKTNVLLGIKKDTLNSLTEIAKIQSVDSSNRIEGIFTSKKRLKELMSEKSKPQNRNEEEILGYRETLKIIHESYECVDVSLNYILQMHQKLYSYSEKAIGGQFKSSDNSIVEVDYEGKERIRFKPVSAFQTPDYVNNLCDEYNKAVKNDSIDSLILIPIFILDFLCIHPFLDGNGRISRLLTLLLLYKHDYLIGKYISTEKIIEETKESYYESLESSSYGWHENENDYEPFIKYFLGIILKAYSELNKRVNDVEKARLTKKDRVTNIICSKLGKFTKKDILDECYDISKITVERTLNDLLKKEIIIKHSQGIKTFYTVNYNSQKQLNKEV